MTDASTRTLRRPTMPAAVKDRCRFCRERNRDGDHPDCLIEWRTWNDPARARLAVFERDGYRCVDCGRVFPESMLQNDHIVPLADGGPNDPSNYVTRCKRDHETKSARESRARNQARAGATRAQTGGRVTAQTSPLPDPPRVGGHVRAATSMIFGVAGVTSGSYLFYGDTYFHTAELAAGGVVAGSGALYLARRARWQRKAEDQRIYERLCRATRQPAVDRRALRVHDRDHATPTDVTFRFGPGYDPTPAAVASLAETFAAAVGRHPHQAHGQLTKRGVRLTVDDTATDEPEEDARVEEPTVDVDAHHARWEDALRAVLDDEDARVTVTARRRDGSPRALTLTYPPRAAKRASDMRADLAETIRDMHAAEHHWFVEWDSERDRFLVEDRPDPLAPVVPLPPLEPNLNLTAGPVLGITEKGEPWRQPLLGHHVLIAGATGSGKGSPLWGIVRALTPLIADGRARLWVLDPKGGMELGAAESFAHRFADCDTDALEVLQEAVECMDADAARLRRIGSRKLEAPTREHPFNLVLVDEIANLTAYSTDPKAMRETKALLSRLLSKGRAVGWSVVGALQEPSKEVLPVRSLFPDAFALRLNEPQQVDMVLGRGMRAKGAVCDLIPDSLPGVGYVVADGKAGSVRVRVAFVSDRDVAELARTMQPARDPGPAAPVRAHAPDPLPLDEAPPTRALPAAPARDTVAARDLFDLTRGARVTFDGDPEAVVFDSVDWTPGEDDMVTVTYRHEDEDVVRATDLDGSDRVAVER